MVRNAKGMGLDSVTEQGAFEDLVGPYAVEQVRYRSRAITEAHALSEADREDLEAELVARVWRMMPKHKPGKASLRTFISLVITNGISEFIRHREADCRAPRKEEYSIDETIIEDGEEIRRGDVIPACNSSQADIDLVIDVRQALTELPAHLRNLCEMMKARSLLEISRETGISRYTLRKWISEVRCIFKSKGLDTYLPALPTGTTR